VSVLAEDVSLEGENVRIEAQRSSARRRHSATWKRTTLSLASTLRLLRLPNRALLMLRETKHVKKKPC
jgi:hypothetical protein